MRGHVFRGRIGLRESIRSFRPGVVMAGGLCVHWRGLEAVCAEANRSGATIVVGGGLASSETELALRSFLADYAVVGQGERTAPDLADALEGGVDPLSVPGVASVPASTGQFVSGPARQDVDDLDSLPWPDYDAFGYGETLDRMRPSDKGLLSLDDNPREYAVVASRSCPFHCTFCWHTSGGRYRQRSVGSVEQELSYAVPKYGANTVTVVDELLGSSDKRLGEFCAMMRRLSERTPWPVKWSCSLRVGDATDIRMRELQESGCYAVGFGLESHSRKVLDSMCKRTTPEQIDEAMRLAEKHKLNPGGNFIFGDPAETEDTAAETLRWWRANRHYGVQLGTIVPCPDSADWRLCLERGLIRDKAEWLRDRMYEPVNMTRMPDRDFHRLVVDLFKANTLEQAWVWPTSYDGDALWAECPHCGSSVVYRRFRLGWGKPSVLCRECRAPFFVSRRARVLAQRAMARATPRAAWVFSMVQCCKRIVSAAGAWAGK